MAYHCGFVQGIKFSLQKVMPGVLHRFCVMHIWRNFSKRWKEKDMRDLVWKCARCTTPIEFKASMEKLNTKNEAAWEYLNNVSPASWTKAHFSEFTKVDTLCNNSCKVFNAVIVILDSSFQLRTNFKTYIINKTT